MQPAPTSVRAQDPHLATALVTAKSFVEAWLGGARVTDDLDAIEALLPLTEGTWPVSVERTPRVGHRMSTTVTFVKTLGEVREDGFTSLELDTSAPAIRLHLKRGRRGGWRVEAVEQMPTASL